MLQYALCAKLGVVGAKVLEILNIHNQKLKKKICILYLFNVKAHQSCIPHTLSRDPNRGNVAVPQSLMNHSICIWQFFTVFITDEMGRFQSSLYLSLNPFCKEMGIFIFPLCFQFCISVVQECGKRNCVVLKCLGT